MLGSLLLLWRANWLLPMRPTHAFGSGDWVLIADVQNRTGEMLFDHSLDAALDIAMSSSKHVNVLPLARLHASLQRLGKPKHAAVDTALALEVASRDGLRAVLACGIERRGDGYLLSAQVIELPSRQMVLRESVAAPQRENVLEALDKLAARVRQRLGEPVSKGDSQGTPLALASSASLDALKLFAQSIRLHPGVGDEGDELLRRAIALDANFAMAMAALASRLAQSSKRERRVQAESLYAQALALPNRLSTRERLRLYPLIDDARFKREEAANGYKAYLAQYPNDTWAWFRLGWTQMAALKRPDQAVEAFRRVVAIDPGDARALTNLATCYESMRQFDKALASYERAFALSPELLLGLHVNGEYGSLLVRLGRVDEARAAFEKMISAPDLMRQARGRRSLAFLLMYLGRYREAIGELGQAIEINQRNHQPLSIFRDHLIRAGAHLSLGATDAARRDLRLVDTWITKLSLGPEWLSRVVKARARLGDVAEVRRLTGLLAAAVGHAHTDTAIGRSLSEDSGHLDLAQAELDLAQGRAASAVAHMAAAAQRLSPELVLGPYARALHAAGRLEEAGAKYSQLLKTMPFGDEEQEEGVAANVALAGIHEQMGRVPEARALYQQLRMQWKDGDTDLVLLKRLRARLKAIDP